MNDDPYVYPGTQVLQNRLGLRDSDELHRAERRLVLDRIAQGVPTGNFDLRHLQEIHRHLFQDIYEWAGKIRTLEISKDGHQFQFQKYIQTGMADVHRRIVAANYLQGLTPKDFAERAAAIIGDVNYVHPFREGNGRTQLQFLKQLAERAGHSIDLTKLQPDQWLQASKEAHQARYSAMARAIESALADGRRQREESSRDAGDNHEHPPRDARNRPRRRR